MKQSSVTRAITNFFKTTTLHGFKYLCSEYNGDRIGWLLCCCASACCAGVLCAVLWARFLQVPALLALQDMRAGLATSQQMPKVAVCAPIEATAEHFFQQINTTEDTRRLPYLLTRLLNGKTVPEYQLLLLNRLLTTNNITFPEMLYNYTPTCKDFVTKCQWQKVYIPCDQLFTKQMTEWGVCCVMEPAKLKNYTRDLVTLLETTRTLDLALECSNGKSIYGCDFISNYESQEWKETTHLVPGYYYLAQLTFTIILDSDAEEKLLENTCVSRKDYSRDKCVTKCLESMCGCSDPLRDFDADPNNDLPPCTVVNFSCLKRKQNRDLSCNCLPPCKKVTTFLTLESSPMELSNTINPIFMGLNISSSIVFDLRVRIGGSKTFYLNPTETWLTLLSSLGGVFNMFLGVGLFSALELLFLILIKLPIAIKRSSEIVYPSAPMYH